MGVRAVWKTEAKKVLKVMLLRAVAIHVVALHGGRADVATCSDQMSGTLGVGCQGVGIWIRGFVKIAIFLNLSKE